MKHALLTVSYAADYERCALLAESVQRFVPPSVPYRIVVSARDARLFRSLADSRTEIVVIEELWPWRLVELKRLRLWLSLRARPVRGWILQQLVKLQADRIVDAEHLVFVDSDVFFVRPFDPATRVVDGLVPLFQSPGLFTHGRYAGWHAASARLLGLPRGEHRNDYISNLVTWRRETLLRLQQRVEAVTAGPWLRALCNTLDLSEYNLYGTFCDRVLGFAAAGHFVEHKPICHSLWHLADAGESPRDAVQRHVRALEPHHVALHIQSRIGVPVALYRDLVGSGAF